MRTSTKRQRPIVRADLLWKELLESFLYSALEIFYPQLYAVIDLGKPPSFLNKELRVPGLHKANKEQRILDLLSDLPLKSGDFVRLLLHVEVEGARGARIKMKEPFHVRMHNYACAITLTQKRPFASLAIRTTPQGRSEKLFYEMDCFGTRHFFEYPTVFIDQLDEETLLGLKRNPVALAVLCAKRMSRALKNECKRYEYAKELLKTMRSAGYTEDTYIRLAHFTEVMSNLSTRKLLKELGDEIDNLLGEVEFVEKGIVLAPVLKKVLRKRIINGVRAEGKAEGKAEGIAEGKAEGIAEGKAEGIAEGIAEGKAEGKAEGIAEGKAEGKMEIALRMLANGMKLEVIAEMTGFSMEELKTIVK